ncbi:hypothetical protein [Pigmentiphaga litoralis]|uniref:hypothetical protein n=1 Tax=Pigmentiphaga litoralis TaxID=516702 RepID=UPI003B42B86E
MHRSLWRFLLILSLLLTLPMQGYAAARMASCDAALAGALAEDGVRAMVRDVLSHDGLQHDAAHHDTGGHSSMQGHDTQGHDTQGIAKNGGHTAHGAVCTSCTPCSPAATLTCIDPAVTTLVSVRVVPPLLVAPASPDLAHPERPPQAFLA